MSLSVEVLKPILENAETSHEDKLKLIIAEHEADVRGLTSKKDELLEKEKQLKENITSLSSDKQVFENKIKELETELKKNSSDETKKYFETQFQIKQQEWEKEKTALSDERDKYKQSHLHRLQHDEIEESIKDLHFIDGLKDGFVARVLLKHKFTAKEVDGNIIFLDSNMKAIKDIFHEFALTNEGKAYLKNPSSGGGATGSTQGRGTITVNPFKKESENLLEQMRLYREDKELAERLEKEAQTN